MTSVITAPGAADGLMTRPSPGLRPPSPGGRGISAEVAARHGLIESLFPPGEGARSADEGRVIRSDPERSRRRVEGPPSLDDERRECEGGPSTPLRLRSGSLGMTHHTRVRNLLTIR